MLSSYLINDGGFLVKLFGLFMLDHVGSQDADFEAEVHGNAERVEAFMACPCAASAGKATIW